MQAFLASDVVYSQRVGAAHQAGARRQRHRRPADRRQPRSCPTSRWLAPATSPRASARSAAAAPPSRHAGARACTATASIEHERRRRRRCSPRRRRQPRPGGRPTRRSRSKFANQGDNDETNVKVTVRSRATTGKADHASTKTRRPDEGRSQQATVEHPARPGAAGRHADHASTRRDRQGPRREERPTTTRRATPSSSRAEPRAARYAVRRRRAYPRGRGRPDARPRGSSRSPPAAVALVALHRRVVLALRAAPAARRPARVLGEHGARDLVAHAAELDRGVPRRCTTTSTTSRRASTRGSAPPRAGSTAPIAYRGLVRYDAYNEMSGRQSTSIALLDAARSGVVLSSIHHRDQARLYAKQVVRRRAASSSSRPRRRRRCARRSPARRPTRRAAAARA